MKCEVITVYFPSWHPDAHYEKWYGKGFSEWELLKTTVPLFEGHHQPKRPSWGFFDESDPVWMEKQIDAAADNGVSVFMFDWYWYGGEKFLEAALEKGFLNAGNRDRLKFFLMWANHDWGKWPAVTGTPGMGLAKENQGNIKLLHIAHSPDDMRRVADYCSEHYFSQPNYWKTEEGEPCFCMYNLETLMEKCGGEDSARAALEVFERQVCKNGFPGVHLIANIGCCDDNPFCCGWDRVAWADRLGFKDVFAYNIVRTPSFPKIPDSLPVVDYREVMDSHHYCWEKIDEGGLNQFPVVTTGCDVSPRWHRGVELPMDFRTLRYEPIIINNTPENFGELLEGALARAGKQKGSLRAVIINAWNEWTEGMYLLPEEKYGMAYLEEIKIRKGLS